MGPIGPARCSTFFSYFGCKRISIHFASGMSTIVSFSIHSKNVKSRVKPIERICVKQGELRIVQHDQ